jgi:hypothetical protein
MQLHPVFKFNEEVSPELLKLLTKTTLGTNGARYQHLDIEERIYEADQPLFLSIERKNKVLGNIAFCRREKFWYIRYFAFDVAFQAGSNQKVQKERNSLFKNQLTVYFDELLDSENAERIETLYAYIDPKNERSKNMSEQFGFQKIALLRTQSFSRINPKNNRVEKLENWEDIKAFVQSTYGNHLFYFESQSTKPPYYAIRDTKGEIVACAKATVVNWKIARLPGKYGGILTKLIPYIPIINRLIRPEKHTFIVPDLVCIKDNNPDLLEELFSGILAIHKLNLILWWLDQKDPVYTDLSSGLNWGILDKILGRPEVEVVARYAQMNVQDLKVPVFVSAFDMV